LLGAHEGTIKISGSRVGDASADFYRFFATDVITAVTTVQNLANLLTG
jgi:hypothetical protein